MVSVSLRDAVGFVDTTQACKDAESAIHACHDAQVRGDVVDGLVRVRNGLGSIDQLSGEDMSDPGISDLVHQVIVSASLLMPLREVLPANTVGYEASKRLFVLYKSISTLAGLVLVDDE